MKEEHKPKLEKVCGARWVIEPIGSTLYRMKCGTCGTILSDGGTPKCLRRVVALTKDQKEKNESSMKKFVNNLFKTT